MKQIPAAETSLTSSSADASHREASGGNENKNLRVEVLEAYREEYRNLIEAALAAYRDEYKEIADSWRNTETKAQGAVAIAGIFAAGTFAFTRDLTNVGGRWQKGFITGALFFLICSVIFSILALYVRKITAPPLGRNVHKKVLDLLGVAIPDEELPDRLNNLKLEQIEQWRRVNEESSEANQTKGTWLLFAQLSLILAILTMGVLTVIILFR